MTAPESSDPVFIDLYAGCGGLSLGLMQAGWTGLFAIEKDSMAFETLKTNLLDGPSSTRYRWPDWLPREPSEIGRFARTHRLHLRALRGKVDLIAGGPPCQGFSFAGRRDKTDRRNRLFENYVEVVDLVQPRVLLLENVRGISVAFGKTQRDRNKTRGRPPVPFSVRIKNKLEDLGYTVYPQLLKAANFGVPQLRPRFFLVALRNDAFDVRSTNPFDRMDAVRLEFLTELGLSLTQPVSVSEAISDLETKGQSLVDCEDSKGFKQVKYVGPQTKYQRLLHGSLGTGSPNSLRLARHGPHIIERFNLILDTCRRGVQLNREDRQRFGLTKQCTVPLHPNRPSHTLTTLPDDILHYSEPRILTVREYARLQSFPDWYTFKGKYTTGGLRRTKECPRYTQVGNAVPPHLAQCLGALLRSMVSDARYSPDSLPGERIAV